MSEANGDRDRCSHTRLGLLVGGGLAVTILAIDWKFLPVAFYVGVATAWGSVAAKGGMWASCVLALRCLLTAVASLVSFCFLAVAVVALVMLWSLIVIHRLDVDSWQRDAIPNRAHIERPEVHTSTLPICLTVGSCAGAAAGLAAWYVASRRWAVCGVISFPLLWLTMYWSECFKSGAVTVPTRVPLIGAVDGGLIMLYLSTAWVALGGWLGDRLRAKRQRRTMMEGSK